ncbi:hypothetical protein [uncultured Exiguobacterium sp.]|uniref:DUF6414 family protein n=1 Tax=uncultured Exiguobacterium sp. TaxID=202669 RepID=UPI0025CD97B2|nr:hypothetical protein [uncultured Exiguobacterium sp.]
MFKNLIYFDSNKVTEYTALLEGKKNIAVKNIKVRSGKSAGVKVAPFSAGIDGSSELEGEILENLLIDCNEFEKLLNNKSEESYFDFFSNDYNLETIPRTSIIRFEGRFNIPEEFDVMDLINQFKPMLASSMNLQDAQEEELFSKIFSKESTKIPSFVNGKNFDDRIGFSKLNSNNLCYAFEHLEDYEDEEVTIIAKVISRKDIQNSKPIVLFDIMKDLFSLSRGIRRQMGNKEIEGIKNIESKENIINLEILAIYQ